MHASPMSQSTNYTSPQHSRPNGVMMTMGRHNHNRSGITIDSNGGSNTPRNLTQRRFNSVMSRSGAGS